MTIFQKAKDLIGISPEKKYDDATENDQETAHINYTTTEGKHVEYVPGGNGEGEYPQYTEEGKFVEYSNGKHIPELESPPSKGMNTPPKQIDDDFMFTPRTNRRVSMGYQSIMDNHIMYRQPDNWKDVLFSLLPSNFATVMIILSILVCAFFKDEISHSYSSFKSRYHL